MKNKFLTFIFLMMGYLSNACPVWHEGDIFVVNEKDIPLNAQVWRVYWNETEHWRDSILIDPNNYGGHWDYSRKTYDSVINRTCIYGHYLWTSGSKRLLRIQVKGYSDLIIRNINFIRPASSGTPKLTVKMYPARYLKTGTKISLFTEFVHEGQIEVRDSMVIGLSDYIESIQMKSTIASLPLNEKTLLVESYPNPVKDYLTLDIQSNIKEPWSVIFTDLSGKQVLKTLVNESLTSFDLSGIPPGTYIMVVYNNNKIPIYSRRFILLRN
jgi:hypothetical protein